VGCDALRSRGSRGQRKIIYSHTGTHRKAALKEDSIELAFSVLYRCMSPNFLIPRTSTDAIGFNVAKEQNVFSRLVVCDEKGS
jgi:hypothetical protein